MLKFRVFMKSSVTGSWKQFNSLEVWGKTISSILMLNIWCRLMWDVRRVIRSTKKYINIQFNKRTVANPAVNDITMWPRWACQCVFVPRGSNVEQRPLWDRVEKLQPRPGSGSSSGSSNSSSQASSGDRFRPRCESPGTVLSHISLTTNC